MREGLTECCRRTAVRVERSGHCCRRAVHAARAMQTARAVQVVRAVQEASANSAEREVTAGEA